MAIIGIDQSLTATGLAHLDNDGNLVRSVCLPTSKMRGVKRLNHICTEILKFCQDTGERYMLAREGYSFGSKGRATFSLGELGGCIDLMLYILHDEGDPNLVAYYVLPPTVVKKFCLGSGSIKKDSGYLLKVYNKFKVEFPDDNQADAFLLAKTLLGFLMAKRSESKEGADRSEFFNSLTAFQKEAILSKLISSRGSGVTKATIKKFEHSEFAEFAALSLEQYLIFG